MTGGGVKQPDRHFLQRHILRVADLAAVGRVQGGRDIDQRTGEQDGTRPFEQGASLDGDQVGVAGTGADKPDLAGHGELPPE